MRKSDGSKFQTGRIALPVFLCPDINAAKVWFELFALSRLTLHVKFSSLALALCLWLSLGRFVSAATTDDVQLLWSLKLADNVSLSSPALARDGTIYLGTFSGHLVAISPEGKKIWQYRAGLEIKSSPAIADDGTIYFGSRDRKLHAVTPHGKALWTFATGAWVDSSPAISHDGTVFFGSWDKNFYAVSPRGELKWKFATSNLITSSPALAADGTVYFGSHDFCFYALTPEGKLKWKFATGGEIDSSPAIANDGTVIFGSSDGNLYALRADGTELWRHRTGGYTASSPVLDAQGNSFFVATKNHISLDRKGKMRWSHPAELPMEMAPAICADGGVLMSQPWHMLIKLDGTNGWPPRWIYNMNFNLASTPAISAEGIIYSTDGRRLYALKTAKASGPAKSSWPLWRGDAQNTGRVQTPE